MAAFWLMRKSCGKSNSEFVRLPIAPLERLRHYRPVCIYRDRFRKNENHPGILEVWPIRAACRGEAFVRLLQDASKRLLNNGLRK